MALQLNTIQLFQEPIQFTKYIHYSLKYLSHFQSFLAKIKYNKIHSSEVTIAAKCVEISSSYP